MSYEVFMEKKATKDMKNIPEKERDRVKRDIRALRDFPDHLDIRKLSGFHNKYRIRSGKWRIIMEIGNKRIVVINVLSRKTAYRK